MRLQRAWMLAVILLLVVGTLGCEDKAAPILVDEPAAKVETVAEPDPVAEEAEPAVVEPVPTTEEQRVSETKKLSGREAVESPSRELPKDGTSTHFTMELKEERGEETTIGKGSLTISSVGKAIVNGQACRWIEVKVFMDRGEEWASLQVWKLLIPDEHLGLDQSPVEHVVEAWQWHGSVKSTDPDADLTALSIGESGEEIEYPELGPRLLGLRVFHPWLCGPLKNVKNLDKAVVESGLGELECEGITGDVTFPDPEVETGNVHVSVEKRLHEKAPFGVVLSQMRTRIESDGKPGEGFTTKLTLMDISEDAESELTLPQSATVSGTVTYDGNPIEEGRIRFLPAGQTPEPGGEAKIVEGKYSMPRDHGILAGSYAVLIWANRLATAAEVAAMKAERNAELLPEELLRVQMVPEKYNLSTTLTAELVAGENTVDFNL